LQLLISVGIRGCRDIFTNNKGLAMETATLEKWQLCSLDVWAGEEEGAWDINCWYNAGVIELPEDFTNEGVLALLLEEGYLIRTDGLAVNDDWSNGYYMQIVDTTNNDYPVYSLSLID
jgi:hypothetical protein